MPLRWIFMNTTVWTVVQRMNDVFDIWISELFVPQHHYTKEPGERPCLNLDKQLSEMETNKQMNESKGCFHCLILGCRASYHLSVLTKPVYSIYSVLVISSRNSHIGSAMNLTIMKVICFSYTQMTRSDVGSFSYQITTFLECSIISSDQLLLPYRLTRLH